MCKIQNTNTCQNVFKIQFKLDGCIVWNAHNTAGEEALLIHIVPVGYAT